MLSGAIERRRGEVEQEWHRTLVLAQAVENIILHRAGKRMRRLDYMFRDMKKPKASMTLAEYHRRRDEAIKQVESRGNSS